MVTLGSADDRAANKETRCAESRGDAPSLRAGRKSDVHQLAERPAEGPGDAIERVGGEPGLAGKRARHVPVVDARDFGQFLGAQPTDGAAGGDDLADALSDGYLSLRVSFHAAGL